MPPQVATILYLGAVAYLFRRDFRAKPNVTSALWIPTLWFFLICTRTFSQWLQAFGVSLSGNTYEEGNPVDAAIFFALIFAGWMVLHRRGFNLAVFMQRNRWMGAFLVFGLISVVWSDFTFVSFKRWIKVLGHPIMIMVLFSEPDPEESVIQMMKRLAYVAYPVSILFIKYYVDLGRTFDAFLGLPTNIGIALDKNMLGSVCMCTGMFLVWYLLKVWQRPRGRERLMELLHIGGVLFLNLWVLYMAHSTTSLVAMLVGIGLILFLGLKSVNREKLTVYLVTTVTVIVVVQSSLDVYGMVLQFLGKDPTLTDRTRVWGDVLQVDINPIIGTGFEGFWLGERMQSIWRIYWWHPIQAHNGYLETYLNLGLVGLGLMVMVIVSAYRKALQMLLAGADFARFRLGFVVAFMLYNWTEAAFKALHPVFFVFFLVALDYGPWPVTKVENTEPIVDTGMPIEPQHV